MSNKFTVSFLNRDLSLPLVQPDVNYVVNRYSWNAIGGPKQATITAYGSENELWKLIQKLREPVTIYDQYADSVWWGYVADIEIRIAKIVLGVSLDQMYNYVRIAYTDAGERATTEFAFDDDSALEYGEREIQLTLGDVDSTVAEQKRDTKLEELKYPVPILKPTISQGGGGLSATLTCRGWHETLGWKYYEQGKGVVSYVNSGLGQQKFGVSYTANTIYFISASFGKPEDGTLRWKYEIADTASGLKAFEKDDIVYTPGNTAALNSGSYIVSQGTRLGDNFTVEEQVTNTASNSGSTFTVTTASSVIQSFKQTSGSAWNAQDVYVRLQKVGDVATAGGTGIKLSFFDDSSGSPNTLTASGSAAASDISTDMLWHKFTLSPSVTLSDDTTYWIQVSPSGDLSGSAYYQVDVNEELGYTDGSFEIYSGCLWHTRTVDADMLFKVIGRVESTCQLVQMYEGYTQAFTAIEIDNSSSKMQDWYRDGDTLVMREFKDILESGTTNDRRLLSTITEDRRIRVFEEPENTTANLYYWSAKGDLFDKWDKLIPRWKVPVGVWAEVKDVNLAVANLDKLANPQRFFVEEMEYSVQDDRIIPTPRNQKTPFDLGEIEEG